MITLFYCIIIHFFDHITKKDKVNPIEKYYYITKMNQNKHLISIKNLSNQYIEKIIEKTDQMKLWIEYGIGKDINERVRGRIMATLFYEPSTRTACSFQTAMLRLGGSFISINESDSSVKKGESLEDTIRTIAGYVDCIVLRHPIKGSSLRASIVSSVPILNAGDGVGEHPTQALLDLYTILFETENNIDFDRSMFYKSMTILFIGDLKNSRTVHSLIYLLSRFSGVRFLYYYPVGLELPNELYEEMNHDNVYKSEQTDLKDLIKEADVVYVTRIQKERFINEDEYNKVCESYLIDNEIMKNAKNNMILMHPLPRNKEISIEVDSDPRAAYFRQAKYGMYVRMAILDSLLSYNNHIHV